jgi:hypothetical protein
MKDCENLDKTETQRYYSNEYEKKVRLPPAKPVA